MSLSRGHEAHPGTVWVWRHPDKVWPLETCSFCGSIKPEIANKLLIQGNDASGSEWKSNWPHKFYIGSIDGKMWKLYSEHLTSLDTNDFTAVTESIFEVFKIRFEYDTIGRLKFRAPSFGYVTYRSKGEPISAEQLDLLYTDELED